MILKNAKIFDENFEVIFGDIKISGEEIQKIGECDERDLQTYDLEGSIIIPGLVDIHIHGILGADVSDGQSVLLQKMSKALAFNGTTTFCPTIMALSQDLTATAVESIVAVKEHEQGAKIGGIYLEGPYLSKDKAGAQNPDVMRLPEILEIRQLNRKAEGLIKIIAIAPELQNAPDFISALSGNYVLSLAHTCASYEQAMDAFDRGASNVTHFYNAMTPFDHREPGVVGAFFDTQKNVTIELICDLVHIHPAAIRTAIKLTPEDNVIFITDSMRAAGMPDGEYVLGELPVSVKNGKALTSEGKLAGSTSTLLQCLKNAILIGIPPKTAIKAATINPARVLGLDHKIGSIKVGKRADFLVVDKDFNIKMVIIGGKPFNRGLLAL